MALGEHKSDHVDASVAGAGLGLGSVQTATTPPIPTRPEPSGAATRERKRRGSRGDHKQVDFAIDADVKEEPGTTPGEFHVRDLPRRSVLDPRSLQKSLRVVTGDACQDIINKLSFYQRYLQDTKELDFKKLVKALTPKWTGLGGTFRQAMSQTPPGNTTLGKALYTTLRDADATSTEAVYRAWCTLLDIYSGNKPAYCEGVLPKNPTPSKARLILAIMAADTRLSNEQRANARERLADSYARDRNIPPSERHRLAFNHYTLAEQEFTKIKQNDARDRVLKKQIQSYRHIITKHPVEAERVRATDWLKTKAQEPIVAPVKILEDIRSIDNEIKENAIRRFLLQGDCAYFFAEKGINQAERAHMLNTAFKYIRSQQAELMELRQLALTLEVNSTHANFNDAIATFKKIAESIHLNKNIIPTLQADIVKLKALCADMAPAAVNTTPQAKGIKNACDRFSSLAAGYRSLEGVLRLEPADRLQTLIELYTGEYKTKEGDALAVFDQFPHPITSHGLRALYHELITLHSKGEASSDQCTMAEFQLLALTQAYYLTPLDEKNYSGVGYAQVHNLRETVTVALHAFVRADTSGDVEDEKSAPVTNHQQRALADQLYNLYSLLTGVTRILEYSDTVPTEESATNLLSTVDMMLGLPNVQRSEGLVVALTNLRETLQNRGNAVEFIAKQFNIPFLALLRAYDPGHDQGHFKNTLMTPPEEVRAYVRDNSFKSLRSHFENLADAARRIAAGAEGYQSTIKAVRKLCLYWFQAPVNSTFKDEIVEFLTTLIADKKALLREILAFNADTGFHATADGNDIIIKMMDAILREDEHAQWEDTESLQMGIGFLSVVDPDGEPKYLRQGLNLIKEGLLKANEYTSKSLIQSAARWYLHQYTDEHNSYQGRDGGLPDELVNALKALEHDGQMTGEIKATLTQYWSVRVLYNGADEKLRAVVDTARQARNTAHEILHSVRNAQRKPIRDAHTGQISLERLAGAASAEAMAAGADSANIPLVGLLKACATLHQAVNTFNLPEGQPEEMEQKLLYPLSLQGDVIHILAAIADGRLPGVTSDQILSRLASETVHYGIEVTEAYHWLIGVIYTAFNPDDASVPFHDQRAFVADLYIYINKRIPADQKVAGIKALFDAADKARKEKDSDVLDALIRDGYQPAPAVEAKPASELRHRPAAAASRDTRYSRDLVRDLTSRGKPLAKTGEQHDYGATEYIALEEGHQPLLGQGDEKSETGSRAGSAGERSQAPSVASGLRSVAADDYDVDDEKERKQPGCLTRTWNWLANTRCGQFTRTVFATGATYGTGAGIAAAAGASTTVTFAAPAAPAAIAGVAAYKGWKATSSYIASEPGKYAVGAAAGGGTSLVIMKFIVGGTYAGTVALPLVIAGSALTGGMLMLTLTNSPGFRKHWHGNQTIRFTYGAIMAALTAVGVTYALENDDALAVPLIDRDTRQGLFALQRLPIAIASAYIAENVGIICYLLWRPTSPLAFAAPEYRAGMPQIELLGQSSLHGYTGVLTKDAPELPPAMEPEEMEQALLPPPPPVTKREQVKEEKEHKVVEHKDNTPVTPVRPVPARPPRRPLGDPVGVYTETQMIGEVRRVIASHEDDKTENTRFVLDGIQGQSVLTPQNLQGYLNDFIRSHKGTTPANGLLVFFVKVNKQEAAQAQWQMIAVYLDAKKEPETAFSICHKGADEKEQAKIQDMLTATAQCRLGTHAIPITMLSIDHVRHNERQVEILDKLATAANKGEPKLAYAAPADGSAIDITNDYPLPELLAATPSRLAAPPAVAAMLSSPSNPATAAGHAIESADRADSKTESKRSPAPVASPAPTRG